MTAETLHTKQLFTSLSETWVELVNMISSTNESRINAVPFESSWTAAQLATHVTKSNKAITQGLHMEGKPAGRNPEAGAPNLKKMFLGFETKFQSPEFIVPENKQASRCLQLLFSNCAAFLPAGLPAHQSNYRICSSRPCSCFLPVIKQILFG